MATKKNPLGWLKKCSVAVGWVDGNKTAEEAYQHLLEKKATGEDQPSLKRPVSLALIARTLNYGREPGTTAEGVHYGRIPARPFMAIAEAKFKGETLPKICRAYLADVVNGKMSQDQFLEMVGSYAVGAVREAMSDKEYWISQGLGLAESTLANRRHGGDQPLVDTGTLRASVSFQVDVGGKKGAIVTPKK